MQWITRSFVLSTLVAGLGQAASGITVAAEGPWRVEARAGLALPTGDLGDVELDPGASLSATLDYRFSDTLSVYGGWGWHLIGADEVEATPDGAIEETGYVLGLAFADVLGATAFHYRVHGGITYEHIEIENDDGDIVEDTGHGTGFELGAALVYPFTTQLSLTPGLRYRRLSRDIDLGGTRSSETLSFISTEVGLAWRF